MSKPEQEKNDVPEATDLPAFTTTPPVEKPAVCKNAHIWKCLKETQLLGILIGGLLTIGASLVTWFYQDVIVAKREDTKQRQQLSTEIHFRVKQARYLLDKGSTVSAANAIVSADGITFIYPQLANMSVLALLGQLDALEYQWPNGVSFDDLILEFMSPHATQEQVTVLVTYVAKATNLANPIPKPPPANSPQAAPAKKPVD